MFVEQNISSQRCFFHWQREAAARCPECGRFYCRECVTEHEDRVLCAACLTRVTAPSIRSKNRFQPVAIFFQSVIGFIVLWAIFYYAAQILLAIPSQIHEGSTWSDFVK